MAEITPEVLSFLMQTMGQSLSPEMMKGALLAKGAEKYSQALRPKQPKQPAGPQLGGQVSVNKQVPGPGPLRSGTTPNQLAILAQLLTMPGFARALLSQGMVQKNAASPQAGIPGVPGPTFEV